MRTVQAPPSRLPPGVRRGQRTPAIEQVERRALHFNLLDAIRQWLDVHTADLEQRRGLPICVEGCGACCETNVPVVTALEGQHAVGSFHVSQDALARARAWLTEPDPDLTVYPEQQPGILLGPRNASTERVQQLAAEIRQVAGGACPFLDDEKRCAVHQARPLACRAYGVTYQPDQFCARPRDADEERTGAFTIDSVQGQDILPLVEDLHDRVRMDEPMVASAGFWPTVLLAQADPYGFVELVKSGMVPLARIAFGPPGTPYPGVLTEAGRMVVAQDRAGQRAPLSVYERTVRLRSRQEDPAIA